MASNYSIGWYRHRFFIFLRMQLFSSSSYVQKKLDKPHPLIYKVGLMIEPVLLIYDEECMEKARNDNHLGNA